MQTASYNSLYICSSAYEIVDIAIPANRLGMNLINIYYLQIQNVYFCNFFLRPRSFAFFLIFFLFILFGSLCLSVGKLLVGTGLTFQWELSYTFGLYSLHIRSLLTLHSDARRINVRRTQGVLWVEICSHWPHRKEDGKKSRIEREISCYASWLISALLQRGTYFNTDLLSFVRI